MKSFLFMSFIIKIFRDLNFYETLKPDVSNFIFRPIIACKPVTFCQILKTHKNEKIRNNH